MTCPPENDPACIFGFRFGSNRGAGHNPKAFPPEMGYTTMAHMAIPQDIWGVARVLEDRYGWSKKEIRGFLGENALRAYKANWK